MEIVSMGKFTTITRFVLYNSSAEVVSNPCVIGCMMLIRYDIDLVNTITHILMLLEFEG